MKNSILQVLLISLIVFSLNNHNSLCSSQSSESRIVTYNYSKDIPVSTDYVFKANCEEIILFNTSAGPFASFSCEGEIEIEIKLKNSIKKPEISPLKHSIFPKIEGNVIRFKIPGPMLFAVMDGHTPLIYVYANPIESKKPDATDPKVKYYKEGKIYEEGEITLKGDETLYIEEGAVVRGNVFAQAGENVKISGYGVLDGSYYDENNRHRTIIYDRCRNSLVEKIIMIEPTAWMIVLGDCDNITVRDVKQLGYVMTSDGVDIVGSRHIVVEDCFLRNHDDCIAIKSFNMGAYEKSITTNWSKDMEDIEVRNCILWSYGGQVFEIGHELTTESIKDVRFKNCEAIVHSYGSIFGIHNADFATISDVLYEDIRVEHFYNKLVDIRIIETKYSGKGVQDRESSRGHIRNVTIRNVDAKVTPWNLGISLSHIGGYDKDHTVENVTFESFKIDGKKITNADQFDLYIKRASNISFK